MGLEFREMERREIRRAADAAAGRPCHEYQKTSEDIWYTSSLTAIWEKAFRYCRSLREITIPSKVWHITDDVFDGCVSLRKVIVRSKVLEDYCWVPEGCEIIEESGTS